MLRGTGQWLQHCVHEEAPEVQQLQSYKVTKGLILQGTLSPVAT